MSFTFEETVQHEEVYEEEDLDSEDSEGESFEKCHSYGDLGNLPVIAMYGHSDGSRVLESPAQRNFCFRRLLKDLRGGSRQMRASRIKRFMCKADRRCTRRWTTKKTYTTPTRALLYLPWRFV